jgi:hypothetical protein
LEEEAKVEFTSIIKSENIVVQWNANDELDMIDPYVETWCIVLWDHAFWWLFKKDSSYSRSTPFKDQEGTNDVVKRILYRYFSYFIYICFCKFELLYNSIS